MNKITAKLEDGWRVDEAQVAETFKLPVPYFADFYLSETDIQTINSLNSIYDQNHLSGISKFLDNAAFVLFDMYGNIIPQKKYQEFGKEWDTIKMDYVRFHRDVNGCVLEILYVTDYTELPFLYKVNELRVIKKESV